MNTGEAAIRMGDIYARTLFELADESHSIDPVMNDLAVLQQVMADNPDFITLMGSPWFTKQYKMQLLQKLLAGKVADLSLDFLMVAAQHERLVFLPQMIGAYTEFFEARQGLQRVRITVARAADPAQVQLISSQISEILKSTIKCEIAVDPSIIGGVVLRYGDKVIDNSVRTRLHRAITAIMKRQDVQG
jgi:F-type H+-transporting ATPase subunit delta